MSNEILDSTVLPINESTPLIRADNEGDERNKSTTPLPQPQLFILLLVRLSSPLSMSIVNSFIYFIVRDYIAESPNRVGYYVGAIASSFALSETLTSIGWGYLSDRVGRKPCLILGLLGSSLGMGLFGLSKSLGWAIATRSLHGIFNGDVSVIKTMVGELTDKTNRPLAFSYLPIMKAIGSILGGLMGAALTNPVKNYPNWFAKDSIWDQYPYFLPCLFAALTNILTAILTYFCLDETLKTEQFNCSSSSDSDIEAPQPSTANEESTALLQGNSQQQTEQKSIFGLNITKDSERIMLSFMFLSLTSIMYNQLIVIWSATSIEKGGLNFKVKDIGKALSAPSFAILIFQLLIYPKLINLFGTLKLYRNLFPFYTLVFFLIPQINTIAKTDNLSLMWTCFMILIVLRATFNTLENTSVNILLVNSAENKGNLGMLYGISRTINGISKSLAPAICGTLFSYSLDNNLPYPFDYHLVWYLLAVITLGTYWYSFKIKSL